MTNTVQYRPSLLAWFISLFSGIGGLIVKLLLLCVLNVITGWAIIVLFTQD